MIKHNNEQENKLITFLEDINKIPLPGWIKNNILLALGKGVGKLIIAGFDWPTAFFESKAEGIRSKTEANKLIQIEAAKQASDLFKTNSDLANRALNYYAEKIINCQNNREDIATKFIQELPKQVIKETNQNTIDEDWLEVFWNVAETKSNENLKFIFGKILAAEVTNPKSISPTTLQLISSINIDIGNSFVKLCNLSICTGNFTFVIHPKADSFFVQYGELTEYDITIDEQLELEGLGLIRSINSINVQIKSKNDTLIEADYAGQKFEIDFGGNGVKIIDFTRAGRELRNLLELTPNQKYTEFLFSIPNSVFKFKK